MMTTVLSDRKFCQKKKDWDRSMLSVCD